MESDTRSGRIDRRGFLRMAGIAGIALAGAACAPTAAPPTATPTKAPAAPSPASNATAAAPVPSPAALKPEEVRAQLYEAAKKEGQVVAYWTGTAEQMEQQRKGFSKAYPGIELKSFQGPGEQLIEKMITESRAGKFTCDAFQFPLEQWIIALKEGLAEQWRPPESVNFPSDAVDPNGYYVTESVVIHVIGYNTQLIPPAEAPKNYEDLLKPMFKGKLGLERECYSWFTQRMKLWSRDKVLDYSKRLATQNLRFIKGHTTLADAVVSGEVSAAVMVHQHRLEQYKAKGAPIQWVAEEPTSVDDNTIGIAKGAPHPNAARLFIDWKLSAEGQDVTFKGEGRHPTRKGYAIPKELQVKVLVPSLEDAASIQKNVPIFKEVFGLV